MSQFVKYVLSTMDLVVPGWWAMEVQSFMSC
jgi:hypothetical protein